MENKSHVPFQTTNQIVYLYYLLLITIMVIYHTNIPQIYYNLRIVHTLNPVTLALGPLEISQQSSAASSRKSTEALPSVPLSSTKRWIAVERPSLACNLRIA
jgi:hypothetical protein